MYQPCFGWTDFMSAVRANPLCGRLSQRQRILTPTESAPFLESRLVTPSRSDIHSCSSAQLPASKPHCEGMVSKYSSLRQARVGCIPE